MPFIPHTPEDIRGMLDAIGVESIDALFDEIPEALRNADLARVPAALIEMDIARTMEARAAQDGRWSSFIGAGAYEHYVPAAVWQIVTRGEFYSAYTPYQAEASQGTLQLLYEFQSMIAGLTGLDAANASLYDGASALAEAVLMAVRLHKASRRVLLPASLHPHYVATVRTIVSSQGVEIQTLPWCPERGTLAAETLESLANPQAAALVIAQPNALGVLEDVHALTDWAHAHGMLAIAAVNPVSLGMLAAPGSWGGRGADIAVGEGQPLGVPLSSGGPYFGYMTCKAAHVRQMPGRIAGRTVDAAGARGFTLTLQAREQHIRRSKATSNICTNQGLAVAAATVHMALLGPQGLQRVAQSCHAGLQRLLELLKPLGVHPRFSAPCFHEAVLDPGAPVQPILDAMREQRILGGLDLSCWPGELGDALLVCVTETKSESDLSDYAQAMAAALARVRGPA